MVWINFTEYEYYGKLPYFYKIGIGPRLLLELGNAFVDIGNQRIVNHFHVNRTTTEEVELHYCQNNLKYFKFDPIQVF